MSTADFSVNVDTSGSFPSVHSRYAGTATALRNANYVTAQVHDDFTMVVEAHNAAGIIQNTILNITPDESFTVFGMEILETPAGGFVVHWKQTDDASPTIRSRLHVFDGNGNAIGGIVDLPLIAGDNTVSQSKLAVLADGDFLRIWIDDLGAGNSLMVQRFSPSGVALAPSGSFDYSILGRSIESVAVRPGPPTPGDPLMDLIVVVDEVVQSPVYHVGTKSSYFIDYFVSNNSSVVGGATKTEIAAYTSDQFSNSSVSASLVSGGYVVVSMPSTQSGGDIMAQLIGPEGQLVGGSFKVNSSIADRFGEADIAALPGGGFVIAWETRTNGDLYANDVRAQIFDENGLRIGDEFTLPSTVGSQYGPKIVSQDAGHFLLYYSELLLDETGARYYQLSKADVAVNASEPLLGTSGPDELTPAAVIDASYLIDGLAGDDVISSRGGNDVLIGGAGDDAIDGGGGSDIARYTGLTADYNIQTNGDGSISVADQRPGAPDGSDSLTNIEALQFLDGIRFADSGGRASFDASTSLVTPAAVLGGSNVDVLDIDTSALAVAGPVIGSVSPDGLAIIFDFDGDGTTDLSISGVEEILINGQHIVIAGDFSQTGLADDTLVYTGTDDADLFDATGVTSTEHVIASGGKGNDELRAGAGPSQLLGGDGDDLLAGGAGDDVLYGGSGVDTAFFAGLRGDFSVLYDQNGELRVTDLRANGASNLGIDRISDVEMVSFDGMIYSVSELQAGFVITGTEANDAINTKKAPAGQPRATAFDDVIFGNGGNDAIDGGAGADQMHGGTGNDTFTIDNAGDQAIELADGGTDTMKSSVVDLTLAAHIEKGTLLDVKGVGADLDISGNDLANTLTGNRGANVLNGGNGKDVLNAKDGNDTLFGDAGDDKLNGNNGDDILNGGAGIDVLTGGAGSDILTGGSEADQFKFDKFMLADGLLFTDTIMDFSGLGGEGDRINLGAIDANGNALDGNQKFAFIGTGAFSGVAGQLRYAQSGGDTWLSGDINGDTLADFQIIATGLHSFVAGDFIL